MAYDVGPVPVELDISEALNQIEELKSEIDSISETHGNSEDPRVLKIVEGLQKIRTELLETEQGFNSLKIGPDIEQSIEYWSRGIEVFTEKLKAAKEEAFSLQIQLSKESGMSMSNIRESYQKDPQSFTNQFVGASAQTAQAYADQMARVATYEQQIAAYEAELAQDRGEVAKAQNLANGLERSASSASVLTARLNQITNPIEKSNTSTKKVVSHTSTWKSLLSGVKTAAHGVKSVFSKITGAFANLKKNSASTFGQMESGFKRGLRTLIKYAFGVRSIFFLYRKLRSAAIEALGEMAQQIPEVNKQMSSIKQSLNQMKGALGTAIQPLLNLLVPALKIVADWVTKIADKVASFFAIITGQKVIYHATAGAVDYAASLDKTGKSAKKAKKEIQGYLSPIDELNKMQKQSEDNADDDSGSGAGGGGISYKAQPVDQKMLDFLKKLKEMWDKGDFYELGAEIGQALKNALDSIPWDYIQEIAAKLGKSIATLINGFVEVEGLGESIGNALAQLGNTILTFLNTFLTETNWDSVGKFFGDIINGITENFDWEALGQFFSNVVNAFSEFVLNFATEVDWQALGQSISDGFEAMWENWDAAQTGQALSEAVKGLFEMLIQFVTETDWAQVGQKIAEFLNSIDWVGVMTDFGTFLGEALKGLLDIIINVLENTDWEEIGKSVIAFIGSIDWTGLYEKISEGIGAALGALAKFIWGLIEDAWNEVVDWWYDVAFEDGEFTMEGLLLGIADVWSDIQQWIYDHIFKPFWDGLCSAFGISSPSKEMNTIGTYIMQGLLNGINSLVNKVIEIWTNIKTKTSEVFNSIKETIATIVTTIKNKVTSVIENIKGTWTSVFESIKSTTKSIFENIWSTIKGIINSILGGIEKMVNGVIRGFNKMVERINALDFDIPDWVPAIGGKSLSFHIPTMSEVSIPRLAQGAVIPPNKQFMAMLGDQKSGTNIETPLSTMVDAFNQAMAQNGSNQSITLNLMLPNKQMIAQYAIEGGQVLQMSRGRNPFLLERG